MQEINLKGYPLSMQQARLWTQQEERSIRYAQCAVWLNGKLDISSFLNVLQNLVQRHDILRTTFRRLSGMEIPVQVVTSYLEVDCPVIDLEHLSAPQQHVYLDEYLTSLQEPIIHLETHPLFVVALLRLSSEKHLLLLHLPALCADAHTLMRIILELSQMYEASFHKMEQNEEPLQYAEVADWQEQLQQAEEAETLREYWRRIDLSQLAAVRLPFSQQKSLVSSGLTSGGEDSYALCAYEVVLEESVAAQIKQRAQHYGVSAEAWLLACWEIALWRLNGMQDSLLGVACNGRIYEELTEELTKALGPLTSIVPFELHIEQDMPFVHIVDLVNKALLETTKRQNYFAWEEASDNGTAFYESYPHFFPLGFEYMEWPASFSSATIQFSLHKSSCYFEKSLLNLCVVQSGEHIQLGFQYNPRSSKLTHIEQLASVFQVLLKSGVAQPEASVSTLAILDSAMQASLLTLGCASTQPISQLGLHQLFEAQVQRSPNDPAVMSSQEQLTYQQLNERANQLAHVLRRRGVGPNVLVGLSLPRQASMVVGLLGILKAGGAYLPLDGGSPATRLTYQLRESKVTLLLTQETVRPHIPEWRGSILCLEELEGELAQASGENHAAESAGEDLAYVIYTSGSTGTPKGVMVRQSSVVNYTQALCHLLGAQPGWHYATVSTLAADLGNTAIFCALASGGCVQVLDYELVTSGEALANWAAQHPIDVLKIVPSHLSALLESPQAQTLLPRRALVLGGEALPAQLVERVRQRGARCQIYNHYGPTETTIGVLVNAVSEEPDEEEQEENQSAPVPVALGRPIANTQVYVLDASLQLVPPGVTGELYLGGAGIARGYVQQPEQTAERFVPHPYSQQPGARLYRTGDLVYYGEAGKIVFVGRSDGQVKLRGYRIEVGEVEAVLRQHPLVWDCAVLLQEEDASTSRLVGYVVARTASGLTSQDLRETLREKLPDYMLPSYFVLLKNLPLTVNGKLDRRKLLRPEWSQESEPAARRETYSPIEEIVVQTWKDLLPLSSIGVDDNFFVLGGHSLLATRVIARLQAIFQIVLSVQMLFEAPTVASFAQRIEQRLRKDEGLDRPPLVAGARPEEIPLSFAQQRLWFLDQLEPGSIAYLTPRALRFSGDLHTEALEKSLEQIIGRHESLRTTFEERAGQPRQVIHPVSCFTLPIIELQGLRHEQREQEARRLATQEAQHPADLAQGPLLRSALLRLNPDEHVLFFTLHHIITDGWSNDVLVRELTTLYQAAVAGVPSPLAPVPVQYADYALWQRGWLQGEVLQAQLAYWRTQLADASPLALPTDHPRPAVQTFGGASQGWQFPLALSQELQALSQHEHVTLFMTLLASFQVLLLRYSGQSDISVGTPIANRQHAQSEGMIGFFVNTLVMRTDLSGNPSFVEVLRRMREVCLAAYAHQDVPFEQVVEALEPQRDLSRSPLFQVMFTLQNMPQEQGEVAGTQVRTLNVESASSKFDLSLSVEETQRGLRCSLEYTTDLFETQTIQRLLSYWQTLLQGVLHDPYLPITEVSLLSAQEHARLLAQGNAMYHYPTPYLSVHQRFEQQVQRTPEAIALIFEEQQISYDVLNRRANHLAHRLRARGVSPEVVVGIYLERSFPLLIALLAVLKTGGAYMPLDPTFPQERLATLLREGRVSIVVTTESLRDRLPVDAATMVYMETHASPLHQDSNANLQLVELPDHLIYLISTSGSTGVPKATGVTRRGFGTMLDWFVQTCAFTSQTRVLVATSFSFDLTQKNLLAALLVGGSVTLVPSGSYDSQQVCQTIAQQAITFLNCVPTMVYPLLEQDRAQGFARLSSLQLVFLGGEAVSIARLLAWLHSSNAPARLLSAYGPTECADIVSCMDVEQPEQYLSAVVPVGRAIPNTRLYLLDAWGNLALEGSIGELYVGGEGVARGYLAQPDGTAACFVPDPFSEEGGARLYRTGDLMRFRLDGTLEFVGRADQQFKIRGYRIELGEIEAVLRAHPGVQESVVVAREDQAGDARLIAYVVEGSTQGLTSQELRTYLQDRLPIYMLPSAFVWLDALPVTPNGKVDRRALPTPEWFRSELAETFIAPDNDVETTLAMIWSQLLRVEQVGVHDNFFALGGDSILSIQMVARAREAGLHLTPKQLFQQQSIAQLARVVTTRTSKQVAQVLVTGPAPLTPIQHWFFARQLPTSEHFNQAVILATPSPLRLHWLDQALESLVLHHDALRLRFERRADGWHQEIAGAPSTSPGLFIDLAGLPDQEQTRVQLALAGVAQAHLDLSMGLLLRTLCFLHGPTRRAHLLLIIHHLAVDGVSWRILFEDLETVYRQLVRTEPIRLADKTTSWQAWAEQIWQYAQTESLLAEQAYWLTPTHLHLPTLPQDRLAESNTIASRATISVSLSVEQTRALLQEVPSVYHTQINEVLLTALVQAFAHWTGSSRLLVDLEGHGREEVIEGVDLSRTVGWFTTLFPVLLEIEAASGPAEALKAVKERLRQIPHRGLGYGLLRFVTQHPEVVAAFAAQPQAQVIFNYLGQFDSSFNEASLFTPAEAPVGALHSPLEPRNHLLEITGSVMGGQLRMNWQYSRAVHHPETTLRLAQGFIDALTTLIVHCQSPEAGGWTPSDFPLVAIRQQQLDELVRQIPQAHLSRPGQSIEDIYPLSPMQAGLLFHSLYAPDAGVYCLQLSWTIQGSLNVEAWRLAWQQVVARHSILRTFFVWQGISEPLQVVCRHVDIPCEIYDWSSLSAQEQQQRTNTLTQEKELKSSDLGSAPLLRLALAYLGEQTYHFHLTWHHLIIDGWSQSILLAEVQDFYQAACQGRMLELTPVRPYRDYIAWVQGQDMQQAERFWRSYLKGFTTPNRLPGRESTPNTTKPQVALQHISCSGVLTAALQKCVQQLHITLNTLLQSAWALLLSHYSGEEDVLFGATTTGRPAELAGGETMVGVFINTLPVRVRVTPHTILSDWLSQLQAEQVEARQYEYTPLSQIQIWSEVQPGQSILESLMVFQNYPVAASVLEQSDDVVIQRSFTVEQTHYPIMVKVVPTKESLIIILQYDKSRFEAAMITRMLQQFQVLLQAIIDHPEQQLADLSLLSAEERSRLLIEWNATKAFYPEHTCVHQLFELQVERTPERIAAVFEDVQLTYRKLDLQANQLAHYLQNQGVGPDVPVGICVENSIEMAISVLGVLKAGGAVVPIDPTYPKERLAFMLADAHIAMLLTQEHLLAYLPAFHDRIVLLDSAWKLIAQQSTTKPVSTVNAEHLMYVIYTSGSTGIPKGVSLPHRALVNLLTWHRSNLCQQARTLQYASLSFDASFHEMFAAWNSGGTLCIITASMRRDVNALVGFLLVMGIEKMILPVVMLQQLAEECGHRNRWIGSLKEITATGEQLQITRPIVEMFEVLANCTLHNHYGPSESHVVTTYALAGSPSEWPTHPPIGRPIANTQIYVLDEHFKPVPIGVVGELYIGGISLARGYLDRPTMTAERFIPNPFVREVSDIYSQGGERLYKTGDLVRYRTDGVIEFLGRRDHQVKIRGYRIELGEIESLLNQHTGIHEVVVLAREDAASDKQLVAYVVLNQTQHVTSNDLQCYLQTSLPDYMIPSSFVMLDGLPLTPNGKVDRRALPAPDSTRPELEVPFISPRTLAEEVVAEIWANVLEVEQIGIHDNFFELGGHSLRAVQVISRLRDAFQVELPLRSLFEKPTIDGLINEIAEVRGGYEIIEEIAKVLKEIEQLSEEAAKDMLYN